MDVHWLRENHKVVLKLWCTQVFFHQDIFEFVLGGYAKTPSFEGPGLHATEASLASRPWWAHGSFREVAAHADSLPLRASANLESLLGALNGPYLLFTQKDAKRGMVFLLHLLQAPYSCNSPLGR